MNLFLTAADLDWGGLIINVVSVFVGLAIYLGVLKTGWGQEHMKFQWAIMLAALLIAVLIAWGVRTLLGI